MPPPAPKRLCLRSLFLSLSQARSGWVFFLEKNRAACVKKHPRADFGAVQKLLSAQWASASAAKRRPVVQHPNIPPNCAVSLWRQLCTLNAGGRNPGSRCRCGRST